MLSKIQMISFDDSVNENETEHNKNYPYTPDHPYRIWIWKKKCIIKLNRKPTRH